MTVVSGKIHSNHSQSDKEALYLDLQKILKNIPPSKNPFEFTRQYISEKYFPRISDSSLRALGVFFVIHLIISLSCLVILMLPFLRRKRDCHWLVKRLYITDKESQKVYPRPLYLLNSGMIMALSQFLGSITTEVYIGMLFRGYSDPEYREKAQLTTCIGFMYSCEFFAYWVMAWSSLYTRLYSEKSYAAKLQSKNRDTIPPTFCNFIFVSFPIITVLLNLVCIYFMSVSISLESKAWFDLVSGFNSTSTVWEKLQRASGNQQAHTTLMGELIKGNRQLEDYGLVLMKYSDKVVSRFRFLCIFWTPVMLITSMVFIYSLASLLLAIHKSIKRRIPNSQCTPAESVSQSQNEGQSDDPLTLTQGQVSKLADRRLIMMKQRFYHLAFRGGVMVLSITSTIIACIMGSIKAVAVVTNPPWRSAMCWVALISGTIATLPITLQCWRLYRDEEALLKPSRTNQKTINTPERFNDINSSESNVLRISIPAPLGQNFCSISSKGTGVQDIKLKELNLII